MAIGHIADTRSRRIAAPFLRDTIPPKQVTADEMALKRRLAARVVTRRAGADVGLVMRMLGLDES